MKLRNLQVVTIFPHKFLVLFLKKCWSPHTSILLCNFSKRVFICSHSFWNTSFNCNETFLTFDLPGSRDIKWKKFLSYFNWIYSYIRIQANWFFIKINCYSNTSWARQFWMRKVSRPDKIMNKLFKYSLHKFNYTLVTFFNDRTYPTSTEKRMILPKNGELTDERKYKQTYKHTDRSRKLFKIVGSTSCMLSKFANSPESIWFGENHH